MICGDTLFYAGCGRVFEGTNAQMLESLNRFKSLPKETQVYCAHEYTLANLAFAELVEPDNQLIKQKINLAREQREQNLPTLPSALFDEFEINPFLRCDQPSVIAAAQQHSGKILNSPVEIFDIIRNWKNNL